MVKKYVCIPRRFLVINACNQGKTLRSLCSFKKSYELLINPTYCTILKKCVRLICMNNNYILIRNTRSIIYLKKKSKLSFIAVIQYFEQLQLRYVNNSEAAIDILSDRHPSLNISQLFQ
jgi:hypothetical protein